MNFEKFIEKKFPGLNHLAISNETYIPGVIINEEDRIVDSMQNIFTDKPASKWNTKKVAARVDSEKISGKQNLDFGAKILGVFRINTGVSADYSLSFEFEKATAVVFDSMNGAIYENDAKSFIRNLKEKDKNRWRDVLHHFVAMESIYVEVFKAKLSRNGSVLTKAEFKKYEQEISIDGDFSWSAAGEMIIKDNTNPIGVRGFLVKRFM